MKNAIAIVLMVCILLTTSAYAENATATLQDLYAQAELAMAIGDYAGAGAKFEALGAYSDASQMAMYCKAIAAAETLGMYDIAVSTFAGLGDFKDSKQMVIYYTARGYQAAGDSIDITTASDDDLATARFSYYNGAETYAQLALFKDCLTRMSECQMKYKDIEAEQKARATAKLEAAYLAAIMLEENGEYEKAIAAFTTIRTYRDSEEHIITCQNAILEPKYQEALALEHQKEYEEAIAAFKTIRTYRDSEEHITTCQNAILESKYQEALSLEESKEYDKAIIEFEKIQDYKDSKEHIAACENAILLERLEAKYQEALIFEDSGDFSSAVDIYMEILDYRDVAYRLDNDKTLKLILTLKSIGSIITFGSYEQDGNTQNGKEPLEWIILDEENGNILLISRYGLEKKAFHNVKLTVVSWANCALRKYLNDEFLRMAFNNEEQTAIVLTNLDNSSEQWYKEWIKDYPNWETQGEGGKATQDRVFLLSYAEANKYFGVTIDNKNNAKGRMSLTPFAIAQGAANKSIDNEITGIWWLRTPGETSPGRASAVAYDGSLYFSDIGSDYAVIRPAIWVNLNALVAIMNKTE